MKFPHSKYPDQSVVEQGEIVFSSENVNNDEIQPDSSADGMPMTQETNLQVESEEIVETSEIIPQSEVDDYTAEGGITSENVPGKIIFPTTIIAKKL